MADMNQVYDALRKANNAGDVEAAKKLTAYIKSQANIPTEKPLENVPLFESFISPATAATGLGLGAKLVEQYGPKFASSIAKEIAPQTGAQMLGQAGAAGAAGLAGELAQRKVPEKYKEYKPAVKQLTELGTGLGLGYTSLLGRGPTPSIPKERIESARYLRDIGGKPSPEQISRGPQSVATSGRLKVQQGVANRQYNKSVGLPESEAFGKDEFATAKNKISNEYNGLLNGRKVTFDDSFFSGIQDLLKKQQSLAASGITFGQSRALIGALERVGNIPQTLKTQIDSLPRIGEEEATAEQSQKALDILNQLIPTVRQQGKIQMDATEYNEIRSILGDAAMRSSNPRTSSSLRKVQGLFDSAADKSMPDIARDLEKTRRNYESLKTLEEAQLKSGSEMGVIPAEAVGNVIQNRVEQGAIYGTNNNLYQLGQAGQALNIMAPSQGKRFAEDVHKGLTPSSTMWGGIRDLVEIPLYPIKKTLGARRLEEPVTMEKSIIPTAAGVTPDLTKKEE